MSEMTVFTPLGTMITKVETDCEFNPIGVITTLRRPDGQTVTLSRTYFDNLTGMICVTAHESGLDLPTVLNSIPGAGSVDEMEMGC